MLWSPQLPQNAPVPGEVLSGKYRVECLLGRGGMGTVFRAENLLTGRQVAIKWCHARGDDEARARARFLREARAAARIRHPHVVDVYDVGEHAGTPFLVMEYLQGETLQHLLERHPWLPPSLVVEWMLAAMEGVAAAHAQGIIHRDLKPDNIFLCERPNGSVHPMVLDFGAAKSLPIGPDPEENHALTRPGALVGSPSYMALEQVDGKPVDRRTDVYALGVILYRALGGELPFRGPTLSSLLTEIATGTAKPLHKLRPDVPPALEAVIARAMAREPERRFESIEALQAALRSLSLGEMYAAARSSPAAPEAKRTAPQKPSAWIAFGAICAFPVAAWLMFARAQGAPHQAQTRAGEARAVLHDAPGRSATRQTSSDVLPLAECLFPASLQCEGSAQRPGHADAAQGSGGNAEPPCSAATPTPVPEQRLPRTARRRPLPVPKKTREPVPYEPALL